MIAIFSPQENKGNIYFCRYFKKIRFFGIHKFAINFASSLQAGGGSGAQKPVSFVLDTCQMSHHTEIHL